MISPWIGGDFGFALIAHRCEDCDDYRSGLSWVRGASAGVTLHSRVAIALERSGLPASSGSGGQLTMLTGRVGVIADLAGKIGVGFGRLKYKDTLVVNERPTWMIGFERCLLERIDGCTFADFSRSQTGSTSTVGLVSGERRMVALRLGFSLRGHFRKGQRVPLPPGS